MKLNQEFIRGLILLLVLVSLVLWGIIHTIRRAENRIQMTVKWAFTLAIVTLMLFSVHLFGFMGVFLIVASGVVLSLMWTPQIVSILFRPLTNVFDGGNLPPEPRPAYSIALSKKNHGRYIEAVRDIRQQLDRFPRDFEGHMLLAEILVEHLNDLPGAELALKRWVAQPEHAPKNITFALYSLADWHLRFGPDREAARQCLQQVVDLLPGSEYALGAAQRIAHLADAESLLSPMERKKFLVPEGVKYPGLSKKQAASPRNAAGEEQLAAEYVKHLEQHPLDTEIREKLAVLYAVQYARLDLAISELEQMIVQPNQPAKRIVHWLNVMADLQIGCGADYETVSQTLQRIIDQFPDTAMAALARSRLAIVKLELKANEKNKAVKLGTYEQRIGLKNK
jgi:tetratricopeptide (TPR) repeat protein